MPLRIKNGYHSTIYVAITYYSPQGCRNHGDWATKGWWGIEPDQQAYVSNTTNRYAGFYAESIDGAVWSGTDTTMYVYPSSFQSCINVTSPVARRVGVRLVDLDFWGERPVTLGK